MKKDLDYYLALPYTTEIEEEPKDEGGGFIATCPLLALRGYGETRDEAAEDLESLKMEFINDWIKEGIAIPEPKEPDPIPSGRLVLRLPRTLHSALRESAKYEGISLNSQIVNLLIKALEDDYHTSLLDDAVTKIMTFQWKTQKNIADMTRSLSEPQKQEICDIYPEASSDNESLYSHRTGVA